MKVREARLKLASHIFSTVPSQTTAIDFPLSLTGLSNMRNIFPWKAVVVLSHGIPPYSYRWLLALFYETGQRCQSYPQPMICSSQKQQKKSEGSREAPKNPPSHHRKWLFFFTEQQADIPLYIMAHVLLEEEIQIWGPNHPCSPKTLQSFFQDRAVKFWVLDKFQRKHNVLNCTALTVAVGHTCISLRPYQLFSAVWIVALLCTNLDKSVSALSTGCFNHYIL